MQIVEIPVIVNIKNEKYPRKKDICSLLKYVIGKGNNEEIEDVRNYAFWGLKNDAEKATVQIIKIQNTFKGSNKGHRMWHMIVSFPAYFDDEILVSIIADKMARLIFERFQLVYGVHTSTENLHIHFAINARSYSDGKKLHIGKGNIKTFIANLMNEANLFLTDTGYVIRSELS